MPSIQHRRSAGIRSMREAEKMRTRLDTPTQKEKRSFVERQQLDEEEE
jgi:hypothetical protein